MSEQPAERRRIVRRRPAIRELAEYEARTEDDPDALTNEELAVLERRARQLWPNGRE